jgi:hypothetical protein
MNRATMLKPDQRFEVDARPVMEQLYGMALPKKHVAVSPGLLVKFDYSPSLLASSAMPSSTGCVAGQMESRRNLRESSRRPARRWIPAAVGERQLSVPCLRERSRGSAPVAKAVRLDYPWYRLLLPGELRPADKKLEAADLSQQGGCPPASTRVCWLRVSCSTN